MESPAGIGFSLRTMIVALAFLPVSQVIAVEARVYQLENGGAVAPHLTIELGQDSNPLRGENGSEASAYMVIEPDLKYILQRRNNKLTIAYSGQYLQYFQQYCTEPTVADPVDPFTNIVDRPGDCSSGGSQSVDKASYQNHALGLVGFLEISRRARANINISTSLSNQPLGTGLSANDARVLADLRQPDAQVRNVVQAGFSYGAYQARGELRFGLRYSDRNYRENAGRTLDGLNESKLEPSGTILYRVGTRTQVFAGVSVGDIPRGDAQRTIDRRFVGVEFDASAITSGTIRVTDVTEDFETGNELGYTGFDVDLTWSPRRYSTVKIGAGRETERATLSQGVGITTKADVEWLHYWRDRVSTLVEVGIERNETTNSLANNDANDRTNILRLEGNYNLRRWLDVGAFVQTDNRTGVSINNQSRDYSRTLVGLTANGTF